jgi:hypothetical protein
MPCCAVLCCAVLCCAVPCCAMPCHAMSCHAMPCHAMPCSKAEPLLRRAVAAREVEYGAAEPETLAAVQSLANALQAARPSHVEEGPLSREGGCLARKGAAPLPH